MKPDELIAHRSVTAPVFGNERVPVILINSLASSVVVFVTKVKVGVTWAAVSLIPPFEEPTTKTKPNRNKAAITHVLILFFPMLFLLLSTFSSEETTCAHAKLARNRLWLTWPSPLQFYVLSCFKTYHFAVEFLEYLNRSSHFTFA